MNLLQEQTTFVHHRQSCIDENAVISRYNKSLNLYIRMIEINTITITGYASQSNGHDNEHSYPSLFSNII